MPGAILRALGKAVRRDLAGYGPIRTNNFFLFVVLLMAGAAGSGVAPLSAYPFLTLLALLLFFPIASDPLEKIPRVRMGLWPLAGGARVALRIAALGMNPLLWIVVAALLHEGRGAAVPVCGLLGAAIVRAQVPRMSGHAAIGRVVPALPGAVGTLMSAQLRGMLTVLDTWLAAAIALIGTAWRIAARDADPAAMPVLAMLVGIALSTQTQSGAGLDATRHRLLPVRAWRVVLARDAAYLLVQAALTAALDPVAGVAFGMAAIAAGRYPALYTRLAVRRWRFTGGRVLFGVLQMAGGAAVAFAGAKGAGIAAAAWLATVWWGGSVLAQRLRGIDAGGAPRR